MCRSANLGTCCAQGCDQQIRCQDTHGYCDEHNPYVIDWSVYDDDEGEVGQVRPTPVDDPEKRRVYDISGLTRAITNAEISITNDQRRLADMRTRLAALDAPSEVPHD